MAKNSNSFFSKLAPEDKRFIRKVGFFLFFLILASCGLLYSYIRFEDEIKDVPVLGAIGPLLGLDKLNDSLATDSLAARDSLPAIGSIGSLDSLGGIDSIAPPPDSAAAPAEKADINFELPEVPEFPGIADELPAVTAEFDKDFDEQAHLQLMRLCAKEYNYKLAYKHGARITSYISSNPDYSAEWGRVLLESGMPKDAAVVFKRLDAKGLVKGESIIDFAFATHRSGNSEEASVYLDGKIREAQSADLIAAKAAIVGEHTDTTKRAAADAIFMQALKLSPSLPMANYYYGRYLMQRGDYKKSKSYLEIAMKAKPNEPRYVARLGMAEFYLKQDASAEALYKRALNLNPYDPNTYFNLGELYISGANESSYISQVKQKTRLALEAYLKAIELDPSHVNAHSRIGLILNGNGEHAEAIKHLDFAYEKMPQNIFVMQQLSAAHLRMQDTAKAIDYLEQILTIDPFNKIAASEYRRISGGASGQGE